MTGTSALALFAFTSTSQTSNGDIAGVNDRTADLTQSWSDLGLVINTTLNNLGAGAPASPTVNRLTTADTTPVVTGTAKLPSGDTLAVVINGTSYTPTLTQIGTTDTYNWAVQVTSALTSNTYNVTATTSRTSGGSTLTASDLTSGELVVNTSIPNQTPTIIAYGDDVAAQTGDFGSGSRTNDTAPLIKGVLDAPLDAGDVVRIYRSTDNGNFVLLNGSATVSGTSWTFQDSSLSNGSSYTYKAVVYDGSNEGSSSGLFTLNVDTSAPTVTLAIANYTDDVGASTGNFLTGSTTDDSTPLLNGTFSTSGATPPLASGEKIEVLRGGVLVGYAQVLPTVDTTSGSITGYTWTFQESELNNGTYSYTARIVDGAGNVGSTSTAFTLTVSQPLDVNDITVNEASAYAVFTVTGTASSTVTLALTAGSATAGTDYSSTLQWSSNGTTWNDYTVSGVTLSGFTKFYVRTAITNDGTYEGPETFKLTATAGTVSASGTATIRDDGTGAVYTGTVTSGTPDTSGTADDDRTVSVSAYSTPVNEASDYAFFTVTGVAGEQIKLDVLDVNDSGSGQTANVGTAPSTYYSLNGGLTWTAYTGSAVTVPSGGSFKVRVDITAEQDTSPEGTEKLSLKAYYDSNNAKSASAEVTISDTGTGDIYLADGSLDTATTKDYDVAAPTQTVVISSMEKDTGSSSTDFITKDGTATRAVTGTISAVLGANEVVQVSFDGGSTWSTATTTGTSWTINDSTVHNGNWVIKARVTNTTGNVSGTEASQSVTLDATAPSLTITLDSSITADDVVNSTEAGGNVTIGGAVTGAPDGTTVTLTINGTSYTGSVSSNRFSISVPGSALTADGDKVIEAAVSLTDTAGNTGTASDTEGYSVDTTAPAPTIELAANITSDDVINAAEAGGNITITGTVGGDAATGDTVTLTINGKTFTGQVASGGFSISVPGSDLVADSDQTISASISSTDTAGNTGTAGDTEGYSVDTVAPLAPSLDLVDTSDSGTSNTDDKTSDTTPTIRVTLNLTGAAGTPAVAGDVVKLKVGNTEVGSATLVAGDITNGYVDITASTQTEGSKSFTAEVIDAAGNSSSASTALPVLIDTTAPALSSASVSGTTLTLRYSESGSGLASTTPSTSAFTVTYGTNNTPVTVSAVTVDPTTDSVKLTLASAIGGTETNIKVSYTPDANPVEDVAGNDAASLSGQAVTNAAGDTTAPTITSSSAVSIYENTTAVLTASANESVTWSLLAGDDKSKFDIDHTTGALTFLTAPDYESPTDTSTSGTNTYLVQIKATDLAGNVTTQDVTVTVLDADEVLTVSNFDMTDATDTGSSQSDEITSNGLPVLTFSGESGLTVTLKGPDGTELTKDTHYSVSYANGVYTVTLLDAVSGGTANPFGTYAGGAATNNPAATADGTYTLSAKDAANNSGTVGTFEINTAPPSKTTVISQMTKDTAANSDFITTDGTANRTVSGTVSAALGTNEVVQVSFDGGSTWANATTTGTGWTINDGGAHTGNWVIKARVTNSLNGVSGTAASQAVTLEGSAPSVSSTSVNEASPYLVWTVTGTAGQRLSLGLTGTATGGGVDYSGALQVKGSGNWVDYDPSDLPTVPAGGSLKIRTALVDDAISDNGETVILTATTVGGQDGSGTNTILDQGDLPPSEWPNFYFRIGHEGGMEWQGRTSRRRSSASCVKLRSCWRRAERLPMRVAGSASPSRATTAGARNMVV